MKNPTLLILLIFICLNGYSQIVQPTKEQVEWADCEIGAIIHFDINVYDPSYQWRKQWDDNP
jgi:alpha-L-fucosidase